MGHFRHFVTRPPVALMRGQKLRLLGHLCGRARTPHLVAHAGELVAPSPGRFGAQQRTGPRCLSTRPLVDLGRAALRLRPKLGPIYRLKQASHFPLWERGRRMRAAPSPIWVPPLRSRRVVAGVLLASPRRAPLRPRWPSAGSGCRSQFKDAALHRPWPVEADRPHQKLIAPFRLETASRRSPGASAGR